MGTNVGSQSVAAPSSSDAAELATLTRALSNALRLKTQGSTSRYDFILTQLRTGADAVLKRLLMALSANVSTLAQPAFESMCTHALAIRLRPVQPPPTSTAAAGVAQGCITSTETAAAYARFAVDIVSANGSFLGSAMRAMVRNLVLIATDLQALGSSGCEAGVQVVPHQQVHAFHALLYAAMCDCVRLVPSCSVTLYSVLAEHFPHKRMPVALHRWYTRHLLALATLLPQLSDRIVATLMDRMVDMDVEINLDELPDEEDAAEATQLTHAQQEAADYAAKLDDMCLLLLRYLHTLMCGCGGTGASNAALAAEGQDTSLRKSSVTTSSVAPAVTSAASVDEMQTTLDALHVSATSEATGGAYRALLERAVVLTEGSLSSDVGSLCCSIRELLHTLHGEEEEEAADAASQHTAASSQHFSPSISPLAVTAQALTLKAAPLTPPDNGAPPALHRAGSNTSVHDDPGVLMDVTAHDDDDDDMAMAGMDGVAAMAAMGRHAETSTRAQAAAPESSGGKDSISSSSACSVLTVRTVPALAAGGADGVHDTPSRPLMSVVSRTPGGVAPASSGTLTRESSTGTAVELHVLASAQLHQYDGAAQAPTSPSFTAPASASGRGKERRDHMFALMLGVFERSVLLTSRSKYCQFTMFYACALDDTFTERFVARLLHQLCNKDRPALTRATSAAYLGSFLARASFLDDTVMRSVMVHMLSFARGYADLFYAHTTRHAQVSQVTASGADSLTVDRFVNSLPPLAPLPAPAIFYATMQSIMYVVCFHAASLREREGGLDFIRQQRLGDLLISELDPLAHTLSTVAREFVRVATALQLVPEAQLAHSTAYVRLAARPGPSNDAASASSSASGAGDDDVTAAQSRAAEIAHIVAASTRVSDLSELGAAAASLANPLEAFFPFDPFILRESSKYFANIFREWSASSLPEEDMGDWLPDDDAGATLPPAAPGARDRTAAASIASSGSGAPQRRSGSRSLSTQARDAADSSDDDDDMQQDDDGDGDGSSEEEDSDGQSGGASFDDGGVRSGHVLMESVPAPVTARMRKSLGMNDALRTMPGDVQLSTGALRSNEDALLAGLDIDIRGAPLAQGYAALPEPGARGSTGSDADPTSSPSTDGHGVSPALMPAAWNSAGPGTSPLFSGGLNHSHGAASVPALALDGKPRVPSTNRARRQAAALAQGMRSKYRGVSFDESTYYASVAAEEGGSASGQSVDMDEDMPAAASSSSATAASAGATTQQRRIVRARRSNSEERRGAAGAPPRPAASSEQQAHVVPAKRPRDSCSSPAGAGYSSSATDASPMATPMAATAAPQPESSMRSLLSAAALPTLVSNGMPAPVFNVSLATAGGQSLPPALVATLRSGSLPSAHDVDTPVSTLLGRSYAAVVSADAALGGGALQPTTALFSAGGSRRFELPSVTAPPLGSLPTLLSQIAAPPTPSSLLSTAPRGATASSAPSTAALPTRSPIIAAAVPPWDIFTTLMYAEADKLERTRSRSALSGSDADGSDADNGAGNTTGSSRMHAAIPSNLGVRSAAAAVLEDALISRTSPSGKSRPKVHSTPLTSAAAPAAAIIHSASANAASATDDGSKKRGTDGRSARKKERRA